MKITDLIVKYPIRFLVWNVNEDAQLFWSDVSTLEDNGFFDPWGQKINIKSGSRVFNSVGDVIEYRLSSDYQGVPIDLVVVNE